MNSVYSLDAIMKREFRCAMEEVVLLYITVRDMLPVDPHNRNTSLFVHSEGNVLHIFQSVCMPACSDYPWKRGKLQRPWIT